MNLRSFNLLDRGSELSQDLRSQRVNRQHAARAKFA